MMVMLAGSEMNPKEEATGVVLNYTICILVHLHLCKDKCEEHSNRREATKN